MEKTAHVQMTTEITVAATGDLLAPVTVKTVQNLTFEPVNWEVAKCLIVNKRFELDMISEYGKNLLSPVIDIRVNFSWTADSNNFIFDSWFLNA